jgi:hypothetical protein
MTEREAIEAMLAQWETGWDEFHPQDPGDPDYVPYTYKNEDYQADQLGDLGAWARVTILHTSSKQITMGSTRKFERRGTVTVQLFGPIGSGGEGPMAQLCDNARTALEGKRLGVVNLYAASPVPQVEQPPWARATLVIPFRYTETRTA